MLAPESTQRPVPVFVSVVRFVPELLTIAPATSPMPVAEPVRVSVLEPAPVAVKGVVNLSSPVPACSIVAPVVVPARLIGRFVMLPEPV